ncbi:amino acid adenylation domain-containing protein [Halomonas elongata]|uniref:amino acid adenylation domain-containing protein n=1 Tax=Halomonas elongata TaxID=2746 RepID=UPI004034E5BE
MILIVKCDLVMRELTPMQAACWSGRHNSAFMGGVAAHLYVELDGHHVDVEGLRSALGRLYGLHPMLRLCVTAEGQQRVSGASPRGLLEVDDFRDLPRSEVEQRLESKRHEWSHQKLDLLHGQAARFSISLLPEGATRLHVDTDMIAIDPSSFCLLMEDLAGFYENPGKEMASPPTFFEWHDSMRASDDHRAAVKRDRQWWSRRLESISPAPSLPLHDMPPEEPRSTRLACWLGPGQRAALRRLAGEYQVTQAALMLGLLAISLGQSTGDRRFRLNVPMFWRAPTIAGVERTVGEFSNVLILDVDLDQADTPAGLCRGLAEQLNALLTHSSYAGVNVMRDLSRHHGSPQLAPIVFTAAMDLPQGELLSERVRRSLGTMGWTISQGPQVALDAQVAAVDGGILINWDIRLDALPEHWVNAAFNRFTSLVCGIADGERKLDESFHRNRVVTEGEVVMTGKSESSEALLLTSLQQAYLLGRGKSQPLGGVAMQEFREYRGQLAADVLRQRLADMVRQHAALRTRIDARRLTQWVDDEPRLNLEEIDLGGMSRQDALQHIDARRDSYTHALFDLEHAAPWNVTIFHLPEEDGGDNLVVFTRFDALILDGWSIAALMRELFEGERPVRPAVAGGKEDGKSRREDDMAYWKAKLAPVTAPPCLPWRRPLDRITSSRFERQSRVLPPEVFRAVSKSGTHQGLFKNSVIMALVFEVLSHWLDEGDLCAGIPVAPGNAGSYANHSSFIAVHWRPGQGGFEERASSLQHDILEGLEHLAYSGIDIARELFERMGVAPTLPVVVTNGLSWPVAGKDSAMRLHTGLTQTPQVAMDIRFSCNAEGALVFDIDYACEALEGEMVSDILTALEKAFHAVSAAGCLTCETRSIIDTRHYHFNAIEADRQHGRFLPSIAANILTEGNHRTAIISGDRHIGYSELGGMVSRIMAAMQARGLKQGEVVAICLHRGPEHTAVTLACALLGLVWVPIDAASPPDRLDYLLSNCLPRLVVAPEGLETGQASVSPQELLAAEPFIGCLDWEALSVSEEPAFYLYTSGTTGKPKCVVLTNRATANVIGCTLDEWEVTADDVFISVTPLHHDMSVFDILGSLAAGATLVLPEPGEEKDAMRWNRLIEQHGVTLWCSVPSILEMLLACRRGNGLQSLRLIAQGGDYIKPAVIADLRRYLPAARLVSLGGPTETTIWSIWYNIGAEDVAAIPYGTALPGNAHFLLDDRGEHCPVGVAGRIHTVGVNVALGYLENGRLTHNDFVTIQDDKGNSVRAFRTGDRGRFRRDGVLVFDSRVDGYVKIRGVRVSLPDIENALLHHAAIRHVLAVNYGEERQGDSNIGVIYVAEDGAELSSAQLRDHARQHLPQSHVPARFVPVPRIPLSANGKPDRRHARSLLLGAESEPGHQPAVAVTEETRAGEVLSIYRNVLGLAPDAGLGAHSDFIEAGLRPQHLRTVASRLEEAFSVTLSPQLLARCRNAGDVTQLLDRAPVTQPSCLEE